MRAICAVALAALLAAGCESGAPEPSAGPTSTTVPPALDTGATVIVAPGYGPLYAVDLDEGLAQRFPATGGVPGDYEHRLIPLDDGVAFPGGTDTRFLAWDLAGPSTSLGASFYPVPSGRPDRVWLVDEHTDGDDDFPDAVREVDGSGSVVTSPVEIPPAFPLAGVADVVVLQARHELLLFDPLANEVRRRIDGTWVLDAQGDRLAVMGDDPARPLVRVFDLGPEGGPPFVSEVGGEPFAAALSPDGRWLAAWAQDDVEQSGRLQLVDLVGGTVTTVAGSEAGPYANLAWSGDSGTVFALGSGGDRPGTYLITHRIGADEATILWTSSLQPGALVVAPPGMGPDLSDADARPCPAVVAPDPNGNPQATVTAGRPCRIRPD